MAEKLMTPDQRANFWDALHQAYPNPACELNWTNPYSLMIAIILSAQSTDKNVNKATEPLFKIADTPEKIKAMGEEKLKTYFRSINYFNNKTRAIIGLTNVILEKFGGEMPTDFDTLLTLPGVGRKTANVFLNVVYRAPFIGVDTHVFRLCHRLKICTGKNPEEIEHKLQKLVPDWFKPDVALALVLHGRYICTAKNPKCCECPLYNVCIADEKKSCN